MKNKQNSKTPEVDPFWDLIESINCDQPNLEERCRRLGEKMRAMSPDDVAYLHGRFMGSLARRHEPPLREAAESRYGKKMNDDEAVAFFAQVLSLGRTTWFAMRREPSTLADLPIHMPDTESGRVFVEALFAVVQEKCGRRDFINLA